MSPGRGFEVIAAQLLRGLLGADVAAVWLPAFMNQRHDEEIAAAQMIEDAPGVARHFAQLFVVDFGDFSKRLP